MRSLRDFMLRIRSWTVFVLIGIGYLTSLLARFESVGSVVNPLFLTVFSVVSPIIAAFWYYSAIHAANQALPQIKQSTVTGLGVALGFYATLPVFLQIVLGLQSINNVDTVRNSVSVIIVVWGVIAGVGVLIASFVASKLLSTARGGGKSDFSEVILGFLGFWILPIGVWFIQPRLNDLQAQICGDNSRAT
jgi:hypothetical protein